MQSEGVLGSLGKMGYRRSRQLLLAVGLLVLLATAGIMFARGVDTIEVIGTLLFVPVFIGFLFWSLRGGVIAATLATAVYIALRLPAIEKVGAANFMGPIISRSLGFFLFGLIGGWASSALAASLDKLELYDQVDDHTGLYNARFLVQDTDLELSRSKRYQTIFSVAHVQFPSRAIEGLPRRQRVAVRRDLGRLLQDAVRTVDRPVHGFDGTSHRFAVVLPETGPEGSNIFTTRLGEKMYEFLRDRGAQISAAEVVTRSLTFPDDGEEPFLELQRDFREIDRHEHPEAAESEAQAPTA